MFFAPTLFKQTRPVDLILPLQNQLPQLQQIVGVDKLAPATLFPLIKSDSRRQYPSDHGDNDPRR